MTEQNTPHLSIIIPVYNEELILYGSIEQIIARMKIFDFDFEIIITENGSTDRTIPIAKELSDKYPYVKLLHHEAPNYGRALKNGILMAKGKYVVCDEIDLCDIEFYQKSMAILESGRAKMVIGSKALAESKDERPLGRRVATKVLNQLLRYGVGFKGTDTHGLKAFIREPLMPVLEECTLDKDLFASEFVIRAYHARLDVTEIPLHVREMRAPSIHLYRRVPKALKDLAKLIYLIRLKG